MTSQVVSTNKKVCDFEYIRRKFSDAGELDPAKLKSLSIEDNNCYLWQRNTSDSVFGLYLQTGQKAEITVRYQENSAEIIATKIDPSINNRVYLYPLMVDILITAINNRSSSLLCKLDKCHGETALKMTLQDFNATEDSQYLRISLSNNSHNLIAKLVSARQKADDLMDDAETQECWSNCIVFWADTIDGTDYECLKLESSDREMVFCVSDKFGPVMEVLVKPWRQELKLEIDMEMPVDINVFTIVLNTILVHAIVNKFEIVSVRPSDNGYFTDYFRAALTAVGFKLTKSKGLLQLETEELNYDLTKTTPSYKNISWQLKYNLNHTYLDYLRNKFTTPSNKFTQLYKVILIAGEYCYIEKINGATTIFRLQEGRGNSVIVELIFDHSAAKIESISIDPDIKSPGYIQVILIEAIITAMHLNKDKLKIRCQNSVLGELLKDALLDIKSTTEGSYFVIDLLESSNFPLAILFPAQQMADKFLQNNSSKELPIRRKAQCNVLDWFYSRNSLYYLLKIEHANEVVTFMAVSADNRNTVSASLRKLFSKEVYIEWYKSESFDEKASAALINLIFEYTIPVGTRMIEIFAAYDQCFSERLVALLETYGFTFNSIGKTMYWECSTSNAKMLDSAAKAFY